MNIAALPGRALTLWFETKLWIRVFGAMVLGAAVGLALGEDVVQLKWIGDVFIRLIRMLVTPLVFVVIASGVCALGDMKKLGGIGLKTLGMYLATIFISTCVGLAVGTALAPGAGVAFTDVAPQAVGTVKSPADVFIGIIPMNPIKALADGDTLAVIFFAVLIGAGVLAAGEAGRPLARGLASASEVMLKIVGFVMEVAPFGVFGLIAVSVGTNGASTFLSVANLALCVLIGSAILTLGLHAAIVRFGAWLPVVPFYRGIADAVMVAFSTASSSATLPVALHVGEKNLGIKAPVASTVLPLGATIGMDGTGMYVGLLTMFAAQAFGVSLDLADCLLIAVTASIVGMGVAPVPSGSLFILATVLATVGIGPEKTALIVGFILPFDRILDMTRTIPNVTCDLSVATAIGRWEKEIDVETYKASPVE